MKPLFVAVPLALALAGSACGLALANSATAADEWTRQYTLAPRGTVEIGNTNGLVEVEAVDGTTVEVRAERIARAATESRARELLVGVTIEEDITPDRVALRTSRPIVAIFGGNLEVRYHVRAPKTATIQARTTNGAIEIIGSAGNVVARTTNGRLTASALSGGVDARTTNGSVDIEIMSLAGVPITLHTTNGRVMLTLPSTGGADLSASWTNGGIDLSAVPFTIQKQSRRRFEGRLNGGGTPVDLQTTNGSIRVRTGA
jgi:hypothetical protein